MEPHLDKDLLLACKKRNKNAFTQLFKSYEKYLFTICISYTGNDHDALDLVQDIFIKVFRFIDKYDLNKPFHPWIRRIAVNTCLNHKRKKEHNVISLNAITFDNHSLEDAIASDEDLDDAIEKTETRNMMKKLLNKLSPRQKMIITLRYYEDLTYNEIASVMNQPLGTVKTDLYRARLTLKKHLSLKQEESSNGM